MIPLFTFLYAESMQREFGNLWRRPSRATIDRRYAYDTISQHSRLVGGEIRCQPNGRRCCILAAYHGPREHGQEIVVPTIKVREKLLIDTILF